jgi:sarcosine oxidase subunit beta
MEQGPKDVDIAIVGGGIAGAAVAWELSRRGVGRVALLEREVLPGSHATGRNASLVLQNVDDDTNALLARYGADFYASPPPELEPAPEFRRTGSLLIASRPEGLRRLEERRARLGQLGIEVIPVDVDEAVRRVPILEPSRVLGGAFTPGDGVVDIHGLLQGLLSAAAAGGVTILRSCTATAVETTSGRVTALATTRGRLACRVVVNAAGAWAGPLGETAGLTIPLRPTRRHLFVTEPSPLFDRNWPFVWEVDSPFYFRPESGGLLLCPCDIVDAPDREETVDPAALGRTAELASGLIPSIGALGVAHAWSGIRTLTPDDRFVIGFDPRLEGFFWMAGMGGHGITGGPAAGRVAADLLTTGRTDMADAGTMSPARFIAS